MSTKVRATVKSSDSRTITLSLLDPYFTVIPEGEDVFVELQTLHGTKVEFHVAVAIVPIEEPAEVTTVFEVTDETGPIAPIKEVKAPKKK